MFGLFKKKTKPQADDVPSAPSLASEVRGLPGQRGELDDYHLPDTDTPAQAPDAPPIDSQVALPPEVLDFLDLRGELNDSDLMINVLDEEACARYSSSMQGIGVGAQLGLIALDDANDSNPYCYVSRGVAGGMVVHFSHDPEPRIAFPGLQAFEAFLRALKSRQLMIFELDSATPAHPDQALLDRELCELGRAPDDDDAVFLICLYLPLLRGEHGSLLEALAAHDDFFVRGAVAEAIGTGAVAVPEAVVRILLADAHSQVRDMTRRALAKRG